MNALLQLRELGQSIWLDSIRRSYLDEGGYLQRLIEAGEIDGLTSNPSIFEKALDEDDAYGDQLRELEGSDASEALWTIMKTDVRMACDAFLPLYRSSDARSGFVSIEVDPAHAFDTGATIDQGLSLSRELDRPNLMIKVPGTEAGIDAVTRLLAEGVNVNVTLLFSVPRYEAVVAAFQQGIRQRAESGGDLSAVASVASFFVSRVDTAVDADLGEDSPRLATAAIANARVAYRSFERAFAGPDWAELAEAGARVQRPLWASTSVKNPDLSDTLYVVELAGPNTVNTMPESALDAVRDYDGPIEDRISGAGDEAEQQMRRLAEEGIDIEQVTKNLESEGVEKFVKSFEAAQQSVSEAIARHT